jgi:P4 family phage/plasmid primase-like protien
MSAPERGTPGTWTWLGFWDGPDLQTGTTAARLPKNERDVARAIMEEAPEGLNFAADTGTWYVWNGRCHAPDRSKVIERRVADFGERISELVGYARSIVWTECAVRLPADASESKIRVEFDKVWAPWSAAEKQGQRLASSAGLAACVSYLAALAGCEESRMAEHAPGRLNVGSGTLDLASLELAPHLRDDLITYCLDTDWVPSAQAPRFWALLSRMCGDVPEVAEYVLKLLGYSLLGDNREQKIIFIAGPTGSGKSQLLRVVSEVLGPLAHNSPPELITVVKNGRNARVENSIRGSRLVAITETSAHMTIDEAQMKRLTGEAVIAVNQHYAKAELKTPATWTIWVATNQMPTLTNFDAAMRRRVIVIPGGPTVPDWQMDKSLAEGILSTEREGILKMLAMGCRQYFREGLEMPFAVREMTEKYALEQNTVANFAADTMVVGGWGGSIPQHDAWRMYQQWATGSSRLSKVEFMDQLGDVPGIIRNKVSRRYEGVTWNADWAIKAG